MTEQQLRHECAKLAAEWNIAGFVNGAIYEDFAIELAMRAVTVECNRCTQKLRDAAERLAPPGKRSNQVDRHVADVLARQADALALGDQPKTLAKK